MHSARTHFQNYAMTVEEKVKRGDYETKLKWPGEIPLPVSLTKRLNEATPEELRNAVSLRDEYNAGVLKVKAERQARDEDIARLKQAFQDDLEKECGVARGGKGNSRHHKADKLYELATDDWSVSEMSEIERRYRRYVVLLDLYGEGE